MNIWAWYDQYQRDLEAAGQPYITQHVDKLIESVADVQPEKTETLLPEARALKKTAGNPWLEIMIGHWEMRHRLGNLGEGERALAEAVSLFERAHQPDVAECPQSICVTQDLSACYANMDGPGWADERIAVCQETMARITPNRNCFLCLSEEQFFAMLDKGETEAALAFIYQQMEKRRAAGEEDVSGLEENEAEALLRLGRYDEALAIVERLYEQEADSSAEQTRQFYMMIRAEILACMGREDEARDWLLPWERLSAGGTLRWARVVEQLVRLNPDYNNWQTGSALQQILNRRVEAEAWRDAIKVAKIHIRLALGRKASWIARRALEQVKPCLARLRAPLGDDTALAELEREVVALEQQVQLPVAPEELMAWLEARGEQEGIERDPEQEAEWLKLAVSQRPEDEPLLLLASAALKACQAPGEAIALLQQWQQRHPDVEREPLFYLLSMLLNTHQYDRILSLAEAYRQTLPHIALWFEAQVAHAREEWDRLELLCQQMRATPEGAEKISPLMLASRAAMKQRAWARAVPYLQQALTLVEQQQQDPNDLLWDLMTAGSACGDWAVVREAGARLGMNFSSESGPIEEEWGVVRLRFYEDHDYNFYLARRTGPVTARVFQPAWRKKPQHIHDLVVFDAAMLNTPPENEEERQHFIGLYDVVHVVEQGDHAPSWFIDGVDPGEEAYTTFVEAVRARGGEVWVHSEGDYQVTDSEAPETPLPGIYFMLSTPLSMSPLEVDQMLQTLTADWPHPVHWLDVALKGGLDETRHRQVIARYQL